LQILAGGVGRLILEGEMVPRWWRSLTPRSARATPPAELRRCSPVAAVPSKRFMSSSRWVSLFRGQ